MKRIASIAVSTIVLLCAVASPAAAQEKGNFAIGLRNSLYTHTGHGAKYGVGIYFRYNILDGLRIEPSATYVCGKKCSTDISVDVHYTFGVRKRMWLYPVVGIGVNEINRWSANFDFGIGYDWGITHHWVLSGSMKYMVQTADHFYLRNPVVPQIGIGYRF